MYSLISNFFTLVLLSTSTAANPLPEQDKQREPRSTVINCLNRYNVPYAVKSSPNWTALTTPYNLRLQYTPAVVTIPTTPDQVSNSVKCGAKSNLKVQPKGGGHSYASYSSGGQDGSLIVDMESFSAITVNQSKLNLMDTRAILPR
jgi:hypothetical protein